MTKAYLCKIVHGDKSSYSMNSVTFSCLMVHSIGILLNTVQPVLKDRPIGHENVVWETGGLLMAGSFVMNVGPSAENVWSSKTGGLSWQWSLKTGITAY